MIRAIAVATDTSDLVGTVELACEPSGLSIAFVRASAYAAAFAPTPPSSGRRIVVPWAHVREAWDDGETLRIALDSPRVPHRRLVLAHLTRDLEMTHGRVHRGRRETEWLVAGVAAIATACAWPVLASIGGGAAILGGAVLTFAAISIAIGVSQSLGRRAMLGGPDQAAVRRAFFDEVRRYLPRGSVRADEALLAAPLAAPARPAEPVRAGRLAELAPALIAAGATAAIALLALTLGGRMSSSDSAPRESLPAATAAPQPPSVPSTIAVPPPEALDTCTCQVPWSPAIPGHVPRVSVLSTVLRAHTDPKRPSLSVEVAAVNNGAQPLREVVGAVTFLSSGPKAGDPLRVRGDKGIYYEGPLASGAAVKWRVGGRGTAYRAAVTDESVVDDSELAGADAFAKLLDAHTRSVRVHGAAMLARARDERASAAIEKLREDARIDEGPVLASLARAIAPIYVCNVELRQEGAAASVSACVMNTGDAPSPRLSAIITASRRGASGEDGMIPLAELALGDAFALPARAGGRVHGVVAIPIRDVDVDVRIEERAAK